MYKNDITNCFVSLLLSQLNEVKYQHKLKQKIQDKKNAQNTAARINTNNTHQPTHHHC